MYSIFANNSESIFSNKLTDAQSSFLLFFCHARVRTVEISFSVPVPIPFAVSKCPTKAASYGCCASLDNNPSATKLMSILPILLKPVPTNILQFYNFQPVHVVIIVQFYKICENSVSVSWNTNILTNSPI